VTDLAGKVLLVTGASKGIGGAIAQAAGAAGADVIAHYGSDRAGAESATRLTAPDRRLLLGSDFADPGAARQLWRDALEWRGHVDVLVSNAAVMLSSPIDADGDTWDDAWDMMLRVNVIESASLIREATRHFIERGGGVLITISSWVAQRGASTPDLLAYSASKAAIKAYVQTIARSHAKDGVLSYVLAPGVVDTEMSERSAAKLGGRVAVEASLAMGEFVPPQEVAELVVFLASGEVRHLTGATLDLNGASYIR
jgi:NAD(P)-dependent dehydrogenase (short-subunit alcohol dehydrogenase family)